MAYTKEGTFAARNNGVTARNIRVSSSIIARQVMIIKSDASTVAELIEDLANYDHPQHGKQVITSGKYTIQASHVELGQGVKVDWNDSLPATGTLVIMVGPKDNENGSTAGWTNALDAGNRDYIDFVECK